MKLFVHVENSQMLLDAVLELVFFLKQVKLVFCKHSPVAISTLVISQLQVAIIFS
jgi:hypothetical protein